MPSEAELLRRKKASTQPSVAAPAPTQGVVSPSQYGTDEGKLKAAQVAGKAFSAATPGFVERPVKNIVNKTLEFLNRYEGAAAEIAALPSETTFGEIAGAAQKGFKEGLQTGPGEGYEKAFPGKPGRFLNVVQPAGFFLPVGTVAREIKATAGGAKEIAGLGLGAAAARSKKAASVIKGTETAGKMVRGAVDQRFRMRDLGLEEMIPLQQQHWGEKSWVDHRRRNAYQKKIDELAPSLESQDKIRVVLEEPKKIPGEADKAFSARHEAWEQNVNELTPNEQMAFNVARTYNKAIETTRTAEGVLLEEMAEAFRQKRGVEHVNRVLASKDEVIQAINDRMGEIGEQPWLLEMREQFEKMPTNPIAVALAKSRGKMTAPGYLKERQLGPLSEIGSLKNMFNRSVSETLGIADAQTAYAAADKMYLQGAQNFLKAEGIAKTGKEKPAGYVKTPSHFPGMDEDLWVPKRVADELYGISKGLRSADEEVTHIALQAIDAMNRLWRNVTLFTVPQFFTRNAIQSPLNAYVDKEVGMGVKAIPTYIEGAALTKRYMTGNWEGKNIVRGTGMTEGQLFETAVKNGIFHAGLSEETFVKPKRPSVLKSVANLPLPTETNPIIRGGYTLQQIIENTNRLSTFMHQLRKGRSVAQAADDVRRVHFDYVHGLTRFQKDYIRRVFPLSSWTMFNLPFQLEALVQNPRAFLNQAKLAGSVQTALGGPAPKRELVPDFLWDNPNLRVDYDEKKKEYRYLMLGGWTTAADLDKITDIHKVLDEIKFQFHFAPKAIDEWNTGWKIGSSKVPPREIGKEGQYKKLFGRDIDRRAEYFIRMIRPIKEASETYDEYRDRGPRAAFERYIFGKAFPLNEQAQLEYFDKVTSYQMSDLRKLYRDNAKDHPERLPKIIERMNELERMRAEVFKGE